MIILTAADADKVRGISPTNDRAALEPIPLKDGTFMLGEEVLTDPAHGDVEGFLAAKPTTKTIAKANQFDGEKPSDAAELATKPTWKDAGKRAA